MWHAVKHEPSPTNSITAWLLVLLSLCVCRFAGPAVVICMTCKQCFNPNLWKKLTYLHVRQFFFRIQINAVTYNYYCVCSVNCTFSSAAHLSFFLKDGKDIKNWFTYSHLYFNLRLHFWRFGLILEYIYLIIYLHISRYTFASLRVDKKWVRLRRSQCSTCTQR